MQISGKSKKVYKDARLLCGLHMEKNFKKQCILSVNVLLYLQSLIVLKPFVCLFFCCSCHMPGCRHTEHEDSIYTCLQCLAHRTLHFFDKHWFNDFQLNQSHIVPQSLGEEREYIYIYYICYIYVTYVTYVILV